MRSKLSKFYAILSIIFMLIILPQLTACTTIEQIKNIQKDRFQINLTEVSNIEHEKTTIYGHEYYECTIKATVSLVDTSKIFESIVVEYSVYDQKGKYLCLVRGIIKRLDSTKSSENVICSGKVKNTKNNEPKYAELTSLYGYSRKE